MVTLCPHLIYDYFAKVKDIVKVYRPQIVEQVDYETIRMGLVSRGVMSQRLDEEISISCAPNRQKIEKVLDTIQHRTWGLESLIMALMDDEENCYQWITEKLFQSYAQYLVVHIKKQKSLKKCDCPDSKSSYIFGLSKQWTKFLKSLDTWIFEVGTSLGFLDQTLYPTPNNLSFIHDKLPLAHRKFEIGSTRDDIICLPVPLLYAGVCSPPKSSLHDSSITITEVNGDSQNSLFCKGPLKSKIDTQQQQQGSYLLLCNRTDDNLIVEIVKNQNPMIDFTCSSRSKLVKCITPSPLPLKSTNLHNKSEKYGRKNSEVVNELGTQTYVSSSSFITSDLEWDYENYTELMLNFIDCQTNKTETGTQTCKLLSLSNVAPQAGKESLIKKNIRNSNGPLKSTQSGKSLQSPKNSMKPPLIQIKKSFQTSPTKCS